MNSGRCSKYFLLRCDLKVSRSQAKIDENFANYFLKTKANNKCCIRLQKRISELERQNLSPRRCDNSKFTLTLKLMRLFIGRLNLCDGCILYVVFHIHVNTHVQCACMSMVQRKSNLKDKRWNVETCIWKHLFFSEIYCKVFIVL